MVFRYGWLLALLMTYSVSSVSAADSLSIHPGCFESLNETPIPNSIDIDRCYHQYQDFPVRDILGLKQFSRASGDAGSNKGTLGCEKILADNWVIIRLEDNAGGTGVFSSVIIAQVDKDPNGTHLVNIQLIDLGDRPLAGIGKTDAGHFIVASALTPGALLETLASPTNQLPDSEKSSRRLRNTIGSPEQQSLACSACLVGTAFYEFSPVDRSWHLAGVDLDTLEWLDQIESPTLRRIVRKVSIASPNGFHVPAESINRDLFAALAEQHPEPYNIRRLQFWLKEMGYYWTGKIDELWGPKTAHALQSAINDLGIDLQADTETLSRKQMSRIASAGIANTRRRLHPVDEASFDPSFKKFIGRLRQAINNTNVNALTNMASDDIMLGLGGSGGRKTLREWLQDGLLWQELTKATDLGAVRFGPDTYCLPYPTCAARSDLLELDSIFMLAITRKSAELLSRPSDNALNRQALDYDLVEVIPDTTPEASNFHQVRLNNGIKGYVKATDGYWMVGYTMQVARTTDGWKIQAFFAGD